MSGTRSGSVRCEPVERQPSGLLPGQNHSLNCHRTGHITRKRNSRMDEDIRVANRRMIMRGVSPPCARMMRINADDAQ